MFQLVVAAIITAFTSAPSGQGHLPGADDTRAEEPLVTATAPVIQDSLNRLWQGSPSWRAAMERLQGAGRRVVIMTPDQVVVRENGRHRPFEADLLAEVSPVVNAEGRVRQVLVVINLPLIQSWHARRIATHSELHADLDRILAHEIYGHAIPYLIEGDLSGHCADPSPGERASDSCAIQRENTIRAELGLGRRTDAGLYSLALTRPSRH